MTPIASWNLQRGVSENKLFSATTYNADSDIDRYVLARIATKEKHRLIIDSDNQDKYETQIAQNIADKLEKMISKTFK